MDIETPGKRGKDGKPKGSRDWVGGEPSKDKGPREWVGDTPSEDRTRVTPRGGGREPEPRMFGIDPAAAGVADAQGDTRTSGQGAGVAHGPATDMRTPTADHTGAKAPFMPSTAANGPHRGGGEGRADDGARYGAVDDRERHGPDKVGRRAPGSRDKESSAGSDAET